MRLSEAKIIITDAKRLPSVLKAANDVGLPSTAIYLFDHGKEPIAQQPYMSFTDLTKHGELDWHDVYGNDAANRLGSSSDLVCSFLIIAAEPPF